MVGERFGGERKESVVEPNHVAKRAVIHAEVVETETIDDVFLVLAEHWLALVVRHGVNQWKFGNLPNFAAAESVNRLLAVAYHHGRPARRKGVIDQRKQVLPLHDRSVLELINEDVAEQFAHALIDERYAEIAEHPLQQFVEFRDVYHFLFVGHQFKLGLDLRPQSIEIECVALTLVEQERANALFVGGFQ